MEAVNGGSLGEDKGGPPPPSPLTGCYLLVVVGEPQSGEHKDIILQRVAKGLLSWDVNNCLVDLEKELSIIIDQGLEGEEARYGERLIQFASENLVTEILIHPAVSTLSQCVRNLLSSFTRHRHIIHAGYTFQGNGSWALQDGTFSYSDFSEAFQEIEVQRVIHAYENGISVDLHCSPEGDWTRLPKETFAKNSKVRVNPTDVLTTGSPSILSFIKYLDPFLVPTSLENILESSDVVGNIRFSRPTLYVFPGGQGDAALFGINGFNMLLDGGYSRKACFWDFVRHLDRLDAVLMTRLNNSSICGISSVLKRKRQGAVYPQVGHFFCNIQERKSLLSPDGDKDRDPLIFSILEEGQSIVQDLQYLHLTPQPCYRDADPIILYHKVGHGTLNMYVLSPDKNSRDVREFLQKWNQTDPKMFAGTRGGRDFSFPLQNLVSICALLVWQPANPNDTITRILYPGSTPQKKIFEGFERLKNLEYIKHPLCSEKSLAPVKKSKQEVIDKLSAKDRVISEKKMENKLIEDVMKNGEMNGDVVREKQVKKSDSLESDKEKKTKKGEDKKFDESKKAEKIEDAEKIVENGEKAKMKPKSDAKPIKKGGDSQHRKKPAAERKGPTTPKKTAENKTNSEVKDKEKKAPQKPSPSATPAKSTKDANNRRVIESKKTPPKKEAATKSVPPADAKPKPERKPISRRPKAAKGPPSPMKKMTNGIQKPDSISKRGKLDKEGTTDSSTVSTPSADQDSVLKKDLSKLTPEEIQQLKEKELDELKEEQEAIKEIEAVFRKGEGHDEQAEPGVRKIKDISIDDNLDTEEYLIIEKEEIEHDSLDQEIKEDEMQKLARDSEESEKQRKLSSEEKEIDIQKEDIQELPTQEILSREDAPAKTTEDTESKKPQVSSPEDKATPTTDKKELADEDVKEVIESHPEEKVSANVESGATTTAPTLPEDERITLDDIKEDNGQPIEEKHVKEDTKEKEVPIIQLPPQSQQDSQPKIPLNVGISLDKQKHIRDIVKTPDEVADLPVHEEADFHEFHGDGKKSNETDNNEQAKEDKKVEEKKEDIVVESKETIDEKDKDVIVKDAKSEEKADVFDKIQGDLKEVTEQEPEKKVIEVVPDVAKDISKDVKTASQAFLDKEKIVHEDSIHADTTELAVVETTAEITVSSPEKSTTKPDEAQKFEILEKAELETKEKAETEIDADLLKESIDDEWVVITKEDEEGQDKIEAAQEAEKVMEENKDDLKDATQADKIVGEIPEHQAAKAEAKEILSQETKEELAKEPSIIPKSPEHDKEYGKEKDMESEGECDDHDIRKEDEIQEILEKDKEDIKALIEEADKKSLPDKNDEKQLDDAKNAIIEEKISHIKELKQEVAVIDDKIQELKKDIHEPVDEVSFSRTKRDLTKIDEPLPPHLKEDVEKLTKIDDKLHELKQTVEDVPIIEKEEFKIEKSTKSPEHAEQVTLPDSSPDDSDHLTFGDLDIDKTELGRKSPAEREEDVKKIVVSVAEVLKSEAPLEEFQGKLPFTQELRETHITTQDSPILEAKVIITDDIPSIPEEPSELKEEPTDLIDRRKDLIADAKELMAASSKVISDIRSKTEETVDQVEKEPEKDGETHAASEKKIEKDIRDDIEGHKDENDEKDEKDDDSGTVHRMLVTASSEDGGEEIEICPPGTITFSKSSESSGRSSPEPSQKTQSQKSSIVETLSDSLSTVRQITEKDLDIEKEEVEEQKSAETLVKDTKNDIIENIKDAKIGVKETKNDIKEEVDEMLKKADDKTTEVLEAVSAKVDELSEKPKSIHDKIQSAETDDIKVVEDLNNLEKNIVKDLEKILSDSKDIKDDTLVDMKETEDKIKENMDHTIKELKYDVEQKTLDAQKVDTIISEETVLKTDDIAAHTTIDKIKQEQEEAVDKSKEMLTDISDSTAVRESIDEIASDIAKKSEEVKDLIKEETKELKDETVDKSKELLTNISGSTAEAKEAIESKVDDALRTSEEVKDSMKEEIKETNDEAVDKSKKVLTDISSDIQDTTEATENKVDHALKTFEEVEDSIKEQIKDGAEDQSKEVITEISSSIADVKEVIESKPDDTLKTSEKVKDLKTELKELKDNAVDKSKEVLPDISSSIADTKDAVKSKVDDDLETSKEVKDSIKEDIKEINDKVVDKSKELLTNISSSIADTTEVIDNKVHDALKTSEEVKDSITEGVEELKDESMAKSKEVFTDISNSIADAKETVKIKVHDALQTSEAVDKSKELLTDISSSIADTKNAVESKVDDALKTSDEVQDLIKDIEETKDEAVDKSEELVADIISTTVDARETVKSQIDDTLKTSEEVKDSIKEDIKEITNQAVDKSKEVITDISSIITDAKEAVESKEDDAVKTSKEAIDSKTKEIKEIKDEAVDKSKEVLTDISSIITDAKEAVETKVDDAVQTSEEAKDSKTKEIKEIKDEAAAKSKEVLTDISSSITDAKEAVESKVDDALKTSEEVKDSKTEEIEESKDQAVDKSKEVLTDISGSTVDASVTTETQFGHALKTSNEVEHLIKEDTKDQHITSKSETLVGEDQKYAETVAEQKPEEISSKVKAAVTDTVKDEFGHVDSQIEEKIQSSKELVGEVHDLKTDKVQAEAKKVAEEKLVGVEASKKVAGEINEEAKLTKSDGKAPEAEKHISSKLGDISASVLDVADKIDETIGIKLEDIKEKADKVESKVIHEDATISDEKTQRRESVVEKAEQFLEKSEQEIGSIFSAIADAAKSVFQEIVPSQKSLASEMEANKTEVGPSAEDEAEEHIKLDSKLDELGFSRKSIPEVMSKDELVGSSQTISEKSTPDISKDFTKEVKEAEDSDDKSKKQEDTTQSVSIGKVEEDISTLIKEADKTTRDITSNIDDIKEKVTEEIHDKRKSVDMETAAEKMFTKAETVEPTSERKSSVVEKAEELLETLEKPVGSACKAIDDAAKSISQEMLPGYKSSDTKTKIDKTHGEKEEIGKLDSIVDSTDLSGKSTSDVLGKDLEAPVISDKSTPDISKDNTTKEVEKSKEEVVPETKEKKGDASDQGVDKQEQGGIMEAAEEFIEKSEKVFESVFSAIGEATKSILHDEQEKDSDEKEKEKSHDEREKTDDKKENLQQEKEIEDDIKPASHKSDAESDIAKATLFDSLTSDKSKIAKETLEKKIEDKAEQESVVFEKCMPPDGVKIDKEVIEAEEKQIEARVSHLEQNLEQVETLSKSISFDKCHISKADKLVQKQDYALEKTLEKVSDMTKSIVLEKDEKIFDANKKEQKELASSSLIDSNKLEDMHRSFDHTCEKEEQHEQQEKKDPEKEHAKPEDQVGEKLEEIKEPPIKDSIKIEDKSPKDIKEESDKPLEYLKDSTECDMTKSVHVEKTDSSPESHKLDDKISEISNSEKSKDILKQDDPSFNAKDNVVLEEHHISSQTEKCEKESMEKSLSEKDSSSLKVERTEPKKLSISDVEINLKTEECPTDASQSFLDNERALLRDNIDAKVYVRPVSSQDDDKVSIDQASSSSIVQVVTEAPAQSEKSSPDLELSGKSTPPTVPVSPVAKEIKSPSSKLDSGLSEQTETDDEDLSTKSQVAHSQSDLDELDMKMDPMSMSFYGTLPGDGGEEVPATLLYEITKAKYATDIKQDSEAKKENVDLMTASFIGELPSAPSDSKPTGSEEVSNKDAVDSWGKPLGLPAPTYLYEVTKAKFSSSSEDLMTCSFIGDTLPSSSSQDRTREKVEPPTDPMTTSVYFEHSGDSGYDPIASWGKPLGLPSPAPPNNNEKSTPKKERKLPAYVTAKNKLNDDKKRAESPSKLRAKKINPVYVDLTYVPHHGNHYYSYVDFFKKIRARYYVFSGLEPSRQVYDALLEAKQTWEDKELEVTIIPTYDTDILGYWVAENEEVLSKFKIDLSPSASRCTINLQDHETSCSAYRLEF